MTILHNIQSIALKRHLAIEIELLKSFDRDLLVPLILCSQGRVVELQIVLHTLLRQHTLLIEPWREGRCDRPEDDQNRKNEQQEQKNKSLPSAIELPGEIAGQAKQDCQQQLVGKVLGTWSLGYKFTIPNTRILDSG